MRCLLVFLCCLPLLAGCGEPSARNTGSSDAAAERDNPGRYLQVNYEVRRNLVGRKVVEGKVINTGKFQTWKTVTLRITAYEDGDANSVNLTLAEPIAPGAGASFRFRPEGKPDRVKVGVASATAD